MSRSRTVLAALALVMVLVVSAFAATTTGTGFDMIGVPHLTLTVYSSTTGDVVCTDTGALTGKRGQIIRSVSGGQTRYVLVRIQRAGNGLFLDEIAAETTATLATAITTFNLATAAPGHPSPTHDATDDALATAMVGYTGS